MLDSLVGEKGRVRWREKREVRDEGREERESWGDVSLDHVRLKIAPSRNLRPKTFSVCFEFVMFGMGRDGGWGWGIFPRPNRVGRVSLSKEEENEYGRK